MFSFFSRECTNLRRPLPPGGVVSGHSRAATARIVFYPKNFWLQKYAGPQRENAVALQGLKNSPARATLVAAAVAADGYMNYTGSLLSEVVRCGEADGHSPRVYNGAGCWRLYDGVECATTATCDYG